MSNLFRSAVIILCNGFWFAACLPSFLWFGMAMGSVKAVQRRILLGIVKRNRNTPWVSKHYKGNDGCLQEFKKMAFVEYEDVAAAIQAMAQGKENHLTKEQVVLLQPTSGSSSATKLIPYTRGLQREFHRAIQPWIAGLYVCWPMLLRGTQYWSISPTTPVKNSGSAIPVGFASDADYLGPLQARIAKFLSPVPPEISLVRDSESFEYCTCLFLLRDRRLTFISIWHPDFLRCILEVLVKRSDEIIRDIRDGTISPRLRLDPDIRTRMMQNNKPDVKRAEELFSMHLSEASNWHKIWPRLRIISCWTEGASGAAAGRLKAFFPRAVIQPKGLIATEGIVSFPLGRTRGILAVTSHFLEFKEIEGKTVKNAWELSIGKRYSVCITTSGGLYRYQLHDIIEVTGFFRGIPCISFIGRDNLVSDVVGEKLNIEHVGHVLQKTIGNAGFAMLAPYFFAEKPGYVLFIEERQPGSYDVLRQRVEEGLFENYHYRHAVALGQLLPLRVFAIRGDAYRQYIEYLVCKGYKRGDIKALMLRKEYEWPGIFQGSIVSDAGGREGRLIQTGVTAVQGI